MHGCKEIVLFIVEHIVVDGHTGGNQLRDPTFHQFLGQFRVFQLVADGHPLARTDEFGQVGVECVVGKSGHLHHFALSAVGSFGEGDAQNVRRDDRILRVGFIEVATAKQQDGIGMLCLELEILFHHGRESHIVCHCLYDENLCRNIFK